MSQAPHATSRPTCTSRPLDGDQPCGAPAVWWYQLGDARVPRCAPHGEETERAWRKHTAHAPSRQPIESAAPPSTSAPKEEPHGQREQPEPRD